MSSTKLEKLSPKQEALIPVIRERAVQRALFDAPEIDLEAARAALNWTYKKAGLKEPKFFIHVSSPLGLQYAANLLKAPGKNVWAQVRDQVGDQVRDQVWAQVGAQVRDQVGDQVRDQVGDQVWAQVGDQVWAQVGDQVRAQVWDQVRDQVGDQVRDQSLQVFSWNFTNLAWDSGWASFGEYFEEIGVLKHDDFREYKKLLDSGIFMDLLFENCAIVCERPKEVHRADNNWLHYDYGPAITWNDGYGLFFLHGVAFAKDLYWKVVNREIGIEDILKNIPNADQRSVALVMADPADFLKQANAKLVSTSVKPTRAKEPTKLYEVPNFMGTGETEFAMTMFCPSTGRPFLEWVEPTVGRKHDADLAQAVAFGISKEQYLAIAPGDEA